MARFFDDGSSQYLYTTTAYSGLSLPISMGCWINSDDTADYWCAMGLGDSSGSYYHGLQVRGDQTGDPIYAISHLTEGSRVAQTTTGFSLNTWHYIVAVLTAIDDRAAFIDGGSKGTNTGGGTAPTLNRASVGVTPDSTPWGYASGGVAEPVIYNVALTDSEVAALATGICPLLIRPNNIISYWPLFRDEDQDRVGGYHFTAYNSPTTMTHPPLANWLPAPRAYHHRAEVEPDLNVAVVPTDSIYQKWGVKIG